MEPTPYQLCQTHEAGRLTDDELINKLAVRDMTSEDWNQVAEAAWTGLIPKELFAKAYDAHESNEEAR